MLHEYLNMQFLTLSPANMEFSIIHETALLPIKSTGEEDAETILLHEYLNMQCIKMNKKIYIIF